MGSNAKAKKLPSGNWRCRAYYTDVNGKRVTESFTAETKKEAERMAAVATITRKHNAKAENRTLGNLADIYINSKENILSPSTVAGYRKIRRNAFPDIIDIRVGNLTSDIYQIAVNEYAREKSATTVRAAHFFFKEVLNHYKIDVADEVTIPKKDKKVIQVPGEEEVSAFMNYIRGTRLYLYVLFAVTLGLRKSEIVALKWNDINFAEQEVSINKARVRNDSGEYIEKTTKTDDGKRTLHIPQVLIDALPEQKSDGNAFVIEDSPAALDSLYKRVSKKAGFNYNFHALRHYYASIMLREGVPNKYAVERMGHATEHMLQRVYQSCFPEKHREIDDMLDKVMNRLAVKEIADAE